MMRKCHQYFMLMDTNLYIVNICDWTQDIRWICKNVLCLRISNFEIHGATLIQIFPRIVSVSQIVQPCFAENKKNAKFGLLNKHIFRYITYIFCLLSNYLINCAYFSISQLDPTPMIITINQTSTSGKYSPFYFQCIYIDNCNEYFLISQKSLWEDHKKLSFHLCASLNFTWLH